MADRFGGDTAAALRDGWRAVERLRDAGGRIGVEQLLPRLAGRAVRTGDVALADRLLAEVESWRSRAEPWITRETVLLVRALACGDTVAARASAALARRRGHRPDLVETCLAIGAVAAEPRPWLRQAYEACGTVPAPFLRSRVTAVMRERGIPPCYPPAEPGRGIRTGCRSRVELAAASLSRLAVERTPGGACRPWSRRPPSPGSAWLPDPPHPEVTPRGPAQDHGRRRDGRRRCRVGGRASRTAAGPGRSRPRAAADARE
ncbi:hypothetical protein [Micromonospora sp. NPDC023814]|uniref:hypothetical protein n=1 Tax=Micromonospora sp. NPDC023814 TaxID=3154596 RepID=UPI00340DED3F